MQLIRRQSKYRRERDAISACCDSQFQALFVTDETEQEMPTCPTSLIFLYFLPSSSAGM